MSGRARPVVVHVITRLIVGGAQLSLVELAGGLRERWDVHVVCGPQEGVEGSLRDRMADLVPVTVAPALVRELAPRSDAAALRQLRAVLRRLDPDIVHTHSSKAGILGRVAASVTGGPKVAHTVHGWGHTPSDASVRRNLFVGLERAMTPITDALVAVSDDVRDEGLRRGIGGPELYRVIPEVVDYRPREPDFVLARRVARERLGIPAGTRVVGWVGRFVEQKDPATLTAALATVLGRAPGVHAVLVGDGPLRRDVLRGLESAGVAGRVTFTGLRPDARALYAAFDVLAHPTLWEGQPRVIQEALAERVPVVAPRVIGTGGLVHEGRTGFMVAPRDPQGMADRLLAVLGEERLRAPIGERDHRAIVERYGHEVAIRGHEDLYRDLLRRP